MSDLAARITARSLDLAGTMARAYGLGAMNALVVITRRGSFDATTREYDESAVSTVYDSATTPGAGGIAGVAPTSGSIPMEVADESQYLDSIMVYIPQDGPLVTPRVDDLVLVVSHPEDHIMGRTYRVMEVPAGGRIITDISLRCSGVAPSRQWQT